MRTLDRSDTIDASTQLQGDCRAKCRTADTHDRRLWQQATNLAAFNSVEYNTLL